MPKFHRNGFFSVIFPKYEFLCSFQSRVMVSMDEPAKCMFCEAEGRKQIWPFGDFPVLSINKILNARCKRCGNLGEMVYLKDWCHISVSETNLGTQPPNHSKFKVPGFGDGDGQRVGDELEKEAFRIEDEKLEEEKNRKKQCQEDEIRRLQEMEDEKIREKQRQKQRENAMVRDREEKAERQKRKKREMEHANETERQRKIEWEKHGDDEKAQRLWNELSNRVKRKETTTIQ